MSSSSLADPLTSCSPQAASFASATNVLAPNPPAVAINGSPYSSWITNMRLNVKSHDKRLNQDAHALEQFLLTHATGRPTVLIECDGTHQEVKLSTRGKDKTVTVTDFHFTVDVSNALLPADTYGAPVWVVADKEPAKRGRYWHQIDYDPNPASLEAGTSPHRRKTAPLLERMLVRDYARLRKSWLPPWTRLSAQSPTGGVRLLLPGDRIRFKDISAQGYLDFDMGPPSKTLAEWTEEYCASRSPLKEFRFIRTVYGWSLDEVQQMVKRTLATCHSGDHRKETVNVIIKGRKVIVRPNNPLWWLYGLGFLRVFFYITLIYPLIMWPIKRYLLGRCWKVAGSSFAFVRYEHLEDSEPGETIAEYIARVPQAPPESNLKVTSRGISSIVGQRFEDWFSANKQTIINAAVSKAYGGPIVI
ncbi:hypothetical protein M407DRAFT_18680 [Tulasnella calospora MUT 4182]|uniref:Uncharacterized protein n=1 Tax=Tulasnella calospora MUT 4182 TaxID=1051891 RepID=A0A0C3QV06_9AGAM|nr:hypothetical protein M407DRAFT_18680 [Tulasnella calospora MUT 4182]